MQKLLSALLIIIASSTGANAYPVHWNAPKSQLNTTLIKVVENVSEKSPVIVNSTLRSKKHNRRVGGARRSYHLSGNAVDFRVRPKTVAQIISLLKNDQRVGGIKHYGGGLFHIDLGKRRTWHSNKRRAPRSIRSRNLPYKTSKPSYDWSLPTGS